MSLHVVYDPNNPSREKHQNTHADPSDASPEQRRQIIQSLGPNLKKGDVIAYYQNIGYRNEGKAIFDGNDIIPLYYDADDYGSVPPAVFVGDDGLKATHWQRPVVVYSDGRVVYDDTKLMYTISKDIIYQGPLIAHNSIVWVDGKKHRKEIVGNIHRRHSISHVTHPDDIKYLLTYFNTDLGRVYIEIIEEYEDTFIDDLIAGKPIGGEGYNEGIGYENVIYYPYKDTEDNSKRSNFVGFL